MLARLIMPYLCNLLNSTRMSDRKKVGYHDRWSADSVHCNPSKRDDIARRQVRHRSQESCQGSIKWALKVMIRGSSNRKKINS